MSRYGLRTRSKEIKTALSAISTLSIPRDQYSWSEKRPTSWLDMPDTSSGQKVAILVPIFDTDYNPFAVTVSGNYTVDWGDGTSNNYSAGVKAEKSYSYAAITTDTATQKATLNGNTYKQVIITITPQSGQNLTSLNLAVRPTGDSRSTSYTSVVSALEISAVGSNFTTFTAQANGYTLPLLKAFTFTGANSITAMSFNRCYELAYISMDMSSVTSLYQMFLYCGSLVKADITTSSVCNSLASAFEGCYALRTIPVNLNYSGVTTAATAFKNTSIETADIVFGSATTTVANMFDTCTRLTRVSLVTPNATTVTQLLQNCNALRVANISAPAATTWSYVFNACNSLQKTVINTAAATTFAGLFYGCTNLEKVSYITAPNVTDVSAMFLGCKSLKSIEGFSNLTLVTTAAQMFNNCINLVRIPTLTFGSALLDMSSMFSGCSSLVVAPTITGTTNVTNFSQMFNTCYSLKTVPTLTTTSANNLASMFSSCVSLVEPPVLTSTVNVTSFTSMFSGCSSLRRGPDLNTSNGTTFSSMFANCYGLVELPTYDLNKAASVTSFVTASSLRELFDISSPLVTTCPLGTTNANYNLTKINKTKWPHSFNIQYTRLSAASLDAIYNLLPNRNAKTITNVTANGTTVTYTCNAAHGLTPGMIITMTGITPSAYNLTSVVIASCPTSTTFTVTNAATGTYTSGGTATPAALTLNITSTIGASADTPSIATTKGWTVTG